MKFVSSLLAFGLAVALLFCTAYSALTHSQAVNRLKLSGVKVDSKCSDRNNPECTSLAGVKVTTINGLQKLKRQSSCPIVVVGGTETGHVNRTKKAHWNGYKADIKPNKCINSYIRKKFKAIGNRSDDGAPQFRSPAKNIYAGESDKWDILYV
ncbi:uncharacterized protein LOC118435963 [Folsomia candida]|uniref:uncharacterized protein LOC118435963 n=1 Tax=Folsomia candida TaxID=158441 RepID=UPI001604DB30|nr:uncharacterized protein LOC118435963 [Folsomia candida]